MSSDEWTVIAWCEICENPETEYEPGDPCPTCDDVALVATAVWKCAEGVPCESEWHHHGYDWHIITDVDGNESDPEVSEAHKAIHEASR